jgi:hypothetical protein
VGDAIETISDGVGSTIAGVSADIHGKHGKGPKDIHFGFHKGKHHKGHVAVDGKGKKYHKGTYIGNKAETITDFVGGKHIYYIAVTIGGWTKN